MIGAAAVLLMLASLIVLNPGTLAYSPERRTFEVSPQRWMEWLAPNAGLKNSGNRGDTKAKIKVDTVATGLHRLKLTLREDVAKGHVALVEETEDKLVLLHLDNDGNLTRFTYSLHALPTDDDFLVAVPLGKIAGVSREAAGKTNDIFVSARSGRVFVSYTHIDARGCAYLNLDEITLDEAGRLQNQAPLYQSKPCVLPPYGLHQTGGRIVEDDSGSLILSVGDFQKGYLTQRDDTDLGKLLRISLAGENSEISRGHRNPQGLFYDSETATLIETEHGPQGGDEINIIRPGLNYGWPAVTYGIPYGGQTEGELYANTMTRYGSHDGFEKPIFAFVPDIGIGQIAKLPNSSFEFPQWCGDYLVAGMRTEDLYRVVMEGQHVLLIEPIHLASIRDFFVAPSGRIIYSTARGKGLGLIERDKGDRG